MRIQLKQPVNPDICKAVTEYHVWHKDRDVEIMRFVCDSEGNSMLWTRVTDEGNNKMSCLLEVDHKYDADGDWVWDVIERDHRKREKENELICDYEKS